MKTTMASALSGHRNSLGLLRLVLAAAVIFSHAKPLGGFGRDPLLGVTNGQASLGSLAVAGFFAISGYVIAQSGLRSDPMQFLWRRALRIFPAFWVVLLVSAFIVAPIAYATSTGKSLLAVFGVDGVGPVQYFFNNWTLTIGSWGIDGVFVTDTPYGRAGHTAMNGSIWTLSYEWICYMVILGLMVFGVLKKAKVLIAALAGFLLLAQLFALTNPAGLAAVAPYLADPLRIQLMFVFLVGATIALYGEQVAYSDSLGILSGVVLLLTLRFGGFQTLGVMAGAYFVLYLGARLPRVFHSIGAKNDYSYGVYIYGFVVQQCLAAMGLWKLGYLPFALVALVITLGCAWLSWHGVEKRAMALKSWGPGRGLAFWYEWLGAQAARLRSAARPRRVGATVSSLIPSTDDVGLAATAIAAEVAPARAAAPVLDPV